MFKRFLKDESAVTVIEFALILPILVLLFAGVFETARYILAAQKVDKAAGRMGDIITQFEDPNITVITNVLNTAPQFLGGFAVGPYEVIMTGILRETNDPAIVVFQERIGASLGGSAVSPGGAGINIPGFTVDVGDSIIVTEVRYDYESFANIIFDDNFFTGIGFDVELPSDFYARGVHRSRITNLNTAADLDACGRPPQAPVDGGGPLPYANAPGFNYPGCTTYNPPASVGWCETQLTTQPVPAFPTASGCP